MSGHYDEAATHYENLSYRCSQCFSACTFTADAQKQAFEVDEKYVFWMPSRCSSCQNELDRLIEKNAIYQMQWNDNPESIKADVSAIENWMGVIKDIKTYGKNTNETMLVCLRKCLDAV